MNAIIRILLIFALVQCSRSSVYKYGSLVVSYDYGSPRAILSNVPSASTLTGMLNRLDKGLPYAFWPDQRLNTFSSISCYSSIIERIPQQLFYKFSSLNSFTAERVQLQEINRDDLMHAWNLNILNLAHNYVTKLENKLFNNSPYLQKIDLSYNKISWIHDNVFEGISKILTRIDLSFNKILTLKEESFILFDSTNTLEINLHYNQLKEITASRQTNEMKKPWINLRISSNSLRSVSLSHVQVQVIDLENNAVESLTLYAPVVTELRVKNNKLKEIHIGSETKLVSAEINEITMVKLENNSKLETLLLPGNKVGDKILADLKKARGLVTLDLSDTSLTSLSADSFSENKILTQLNLDKNSISSIDYGVFSHQTNLRQLNISHNNLQAIDFHVLASLSSLHTLDISGNKISQINQYETLNQILPKLSNLGLEGNNWNCEYFVKLQINLRSQNILIVKAIRPVTKSPNNAGIGCSNSSKAIEFSNQDEVTPPPQQFMISLNSTAIGFAIVLAVLVTLAVIAGVQKVRKFHISNNNMPRHMQSSRHSLKNTVAIATFDNTSVQTLLKMYGEASV